MTKIVVVFRVTATKRKRNESKIGNKKYVLILSMRYGTKRYNDKANEKKYI